MIAFTNIHISGQQKNKLMEVKYRVQLMDLVKELDLHGDVAELGCAEGYFADELLRAGASRLYMIDNWATIPNIKGDGNFPQHWHNANYDKAMNRIKPYQERVVVLRGLTTWAVQFVPDESLAMLYLDASHDYDAVLNDLNLYMPKVVDGGIIAGHDFVNPAYGVKEAVEEFCRGKYEIFVIHERKPEDAGFYFIKPKPLQ